MPNTQHRMMRRIAHLQVQAQVSPLYCCTVRTAAQVLAAQHRYEIGLEKLEFTASQVRYRRQYRKLYGAVQDWCTPCTVDPWAGPGCHLVHSCTHASLPNWYSCTASCTATHARTALYCASGGGDAPGAAGPEARPAEDGGSGSLCHTAGVREWERVIEWWSHGGYSLVEGGSPSHVAHTLTLWVQPGGDTPLSHTTYVLPCHPAHTPPSHTPTHAAAGLTPHLTPAHS